MRDTFLFAAISLLLACGPSVDPSFRPPIVGTQTNPPPEGVTQGGERPGGGSDAPPRKAPADERWTWSAGIVSAWRVDGVIGDILPLDDSRGIAIASGRLYTVAFAGGVTSVKGGFEKGTPSALVHAGGRVLAYGSSGKLAAAWTIDPVTLTVERVELPGPSVGKGTKGRVAIAVSPDGRRVLTCSDDRWPTVRAAVTLAPIATFTGADSCNSPRFVDDNRVLLDRPDSRSGGRVGDIMTGKVIKLKVGTTLPIPGPGGRAATVESRKVTLSENGREVASYTTARLTSPQWLTDGSAVLSTTKGALTVLATKPGQSERTVELPAPFRRWVPIPGTSRLLFQVGPHRLGVYDIPGGTSLSAEGANLGDVVTIAVIDGAVVSGAERVRVWRDQAIAAAGPLATAEMIDVDAGKPALYATLDGVFTMDLRSGEIDAVDADAASMAADRHGDRILYDADEFVKAKRPRGGAARWFKRTDDFFVTDVDAANGRVAMTDDDAFYVARPDEGELVGFHSFDCQDPLYLYLERGRERAAAYDGVTVHLYDTEKEKGLGGIELTDDNIEALAFIPGSTDLALVGESLYLWDPLRNNVLVWPLPLAHAGVGATAIAVDPTGTQLAVGFADGSVLWATIAGVRANGKRAGGDLYTGRAAASTLCRGKGMVKTLAEVRGPDDGDADDDDDDEGD